VDGVRGKGSEDGREWWDDEGMSMIAEEGIKKVS